ncbi:DUF4387 family protein [Dactylosporangium darangshiense]|uniref:DUF4387 domain-containing protein n=1 Tax=Dactylosporangium darangshiense TaxID=579108 RepID=A0ABP8DW12_9ACTN
MNVALGAQAIVVDGGSTDSGPYYLGAATAKTTRAAVIAELYRVDALTVRLFPLPTINVIKASLPSPTAQGSFADRDIHAGQQHVPLLLLPIVASD